MKTSTPLGLFLLIFAAIGCQPSKDTASQALSKFTAQVQQLGSSISLGMARSNVLAKAGRPTMTHAGVGPYGNWTADDYIFNPPLEHYPLITNGFSLGYSNDVVVRKEDYASMAP